jgi:hypothetical protein
MHIAERIATREFRYKSNTATLCHDFNAATLSFVIRIDASLSTFRIHSTRSRDLRNNCNNRSEKLELIAKRLRIANELADKGSS